MTDTPQVPSPETIRQQELARFVLKAIRIRAIFVPIIAALATALVLLEPTTWKVAILVAAATVWGSIVAMDLAWLRKKRPNAFSFYPMELVLSALMQTCMIVITGGVESPLVVVWIPLGMLAGVGLGRRSGRWWVITAISAMLWLVTLSGLLHWVPRTLPSFLQLDPGFHDNSVYVITKAAILNGVIVAASQVGAAWYGVIERMLEQAATARQQALEALADRNRELVHLSSTIAHELKNPLASVAGLIQLLALGRANPDRQEERFQMLGKEVDRMRHRLDELLNFSRPVGDPELGQTAPLELMRQITSLHEGMARSGGVEVELPAQDPGALHCDGRKVKQALVNLLQNALEASPPGSVVRWIAAQEGDQMVLGVEDSGPGIEEQALELSLRAGFTTKEGGSGIGLTVARGIAEQHGGGLTLENRPQGGAKAVIRLPVKRPSPGETP